MLRATIVELPPMAIIYLLIPGGHAAGHRTYHQDVVVMGTDCSASPAPIDTDDPSEHSPFSGEFLIMTTVSATDKVLSGTVVIPGESGDPPSNYTVTYSFTR